MHQAFQDEAVVRSWQRRAGLRALLLAEPTRQMLAAAGIHAGSRVLDVGTGTGDTALAAANLAGPAGHVLAIDSSAAMVEQAKANVLQAGVNSVEVRVMDGAELGFADGSLDALIGRNAMQFLAGWPAPLRGFHRVLRPGGRLAFLVMASKDRNRFFQLPLSVAEEHGWMRVPAAVLETSYGLQDAGRLLGDLDADGFQEVKVEPTVGELITEDGAALVEYLRQGPMFRRNYDLLDDRDRERFDDAMAAAIEGFRQGAAYRVAVTCLLASASR